MSCPIIFNSYTVVSFEFTSVTKIAPTYYSTEDYYSRCYFQDRPNKKRHKAKLGNIVILFRFLAGSDLDSKLALGAC